MSGGLVAIGVGAFLILMGFVGTMPWSVHPAFPRRRWVDDTLGDEPFGYLLIALGGIVVAGGVAGFTGGWLTDPEDPPLGVLLVFVGAAGIWSWLYDRLYQRLRRPQPTSRWARLIGGLGRTGKRVGPPILVAGVILTLVL
jgi:hypothetical protein